MTRSEASNADAISSDIAARSTPIVEGPFSTSTNAPRIRAPRSPLNSSFSRRSSTSLFVISLPIVLDFATTYILRLGFCSSIFCINARSNTPSPFSPKINMIVFVSREITYSFMKASASCSSPEEAKLLLISPPVDSFNNSFISTLCLWLKSVRALILSAVFALSTFSIPDFGSKGAKAISIARDASVRYCCSVRSCRAGWPNDSGVHSQSLLTVVSTYSRCLY